MGKVIAKRFIFMIPVVLAVTFIIFMLSFISAGDAARVLAEKKYEHPSPEQVEEVRHEEGLDQPVLVQYGKWLDQALHGDFGKSYSTRKPAFEELKRYFPQTFKLAVTSFLLLMIVSVPLGILSAIYENRVLDKVIRILSSLSVSMPSFWIGLMLLYIFGVKLKVISVIGGDAGGIPILAAFAMDISFFGIMTRLIRTNMIQVLKQDYIRASRAKGLSSVNVILRHGLKNILIPVLTRLVSIVIGFFCGSAVIESIFSIQGIGNGNITVYGRKKNWEGGNYEDGIQQKTEKSMIQNLYWKQVFRSPKTKIGLMVVIIFALAAIFAPVLAPHDPLLVDVSIKLKNPSAAYPLGTDQLGRCILSRLLWGSRYSLSYSFTVLLITVCVGVPIGLFAGYVGGKIDSIIMRIIDVFMAMPVFIVALAIAGTVGASGAHLILSLSVVSWAEYARLARALTLQEKNKNYMTALKAGGCGHARIIFRHVLRNILPSVIALATMEIGSIILSIAGFSFIGLGVQAPTPEWGIMLSDSRSYIQTYPRLMFYPGILIMIIVLAFNYLGEGIQNGTAQK